MEKAQTEGPLTSYLAPTTARTLANVKPVPDWLDRALTGNYNQLEEAKRQRNLLGIARQERAVARLRRLAGL